MNTALKRVVSADGFYQCATKRAIRQKIHDESRMTVLYGIIRNLGTAIRDGTLAELYDETTRYKDEWFSYDFIKEQQKKDDIACFERFVTFLSDSEVVSGYFPFQLETNENIVESHVDLIAKKGNRYTAYIVRFKKADKSPNGKSVHTNSETDVSAMAAKAALEEKYPGIDIALVFLTNENDSLGSIGPFVVNKTRKSNIFTSSYTSFCDEGLGLNRALLLGRLDEVLSVKVEPNCFNCDSKDLCQQNTVSNVSTAKPKGEVAEVMRPYAMPRYTESQQRVIDKTEGPLLVCAGPGSGKTATLVGRIRHLIEMGIDPEFILAITFTKDAAGELMQRCQSFTDDVPEILTLNALGYQILRLNPDYVGKVALMTKRDRISLISSLLEVTKPLEGFNYTQLKGGNGLLSKVDSALTAYQKGSRDFNEDFLNFAALFNEAVKEHGYITFDEQISKAQELFDAHPEVLNGISSCYKYIMVDEFQDIDDVQAKFIYSLSQKYKNICCVGDDDQSIYAFRGATNKYMLGFRKLFPDADIYTLRENFRSKEEILLAAQRQLVGNKRIKKELVPTRKGGISPIHVNGQQSEDLENVIEKIVSDGISYEDIAVIASKNATLESLYSKVSFPSVLGKEFLVDSPLFKVVFFALKYIFTGENKCAVYLEGLVGEQEKLKGILELSGEQLAIKYCEQVATILGLDDTATFDALSNVIINEHCKSLSSLYEIMQYMCDFGDDTRIEPDTTGRVVFITSHESKGMEWKVVVMVDDYKDEVSEELNRLVYVAMTRAKDLLYVMDNPKKQYKAA